MSEATRRVFDEPVDPDVESAVDRSNETPGSEARIVGVIALRGVVGAVGRYQIGLWYPPSPNGFPATTLGINVVGSVLLAALVVLVSDLWTRRKLLRPLLGTGVLGGFTTFSTFAVDIERLTSHARWTTALAYTVVTVAACFAATLGAARTTRGVVRRVQR